MIDPPRFNDRLGLDQRGELVHVQTLIAETPVKRLNECAFDGFPRSNKIELYASPISPIFQCTRLKFGAMINCDRARPRPIVQDRIEHRTQSTPLIDHGQDLRWTSITQSIMREIHIPAFLRTRAHWGWPRCRAIGLRRRARSTVGLKHADDRHHAQWVGAPAQPGHASHRLYLFQKRNASSVTCCANATSWCDTREGLINSIFRADIIQIFSVLRSGYQESRINQTFPRFRAAHFLSS